MKRTPPFPGFSRGIPIIGQPQPKPGAPPPGAYYYQVPALIQRPGAALEIETYEVRLPQPMEGVRFTALQRQVADELAGDGPRPKVVLLAPYFLGFVPQEEVERQGSTSDAALSRMTES